MPILTGLLQPIRADGIDKLVNKDAPRYGLFIVGLAILLLLVASPARGQRFSRRYADCLSLDCAAAAKSYSFDPSPAPPPQESSSASLIPPRPAAASADPVREGTWRKLPSNFLHDQKDMWLFPLKVVQGHYWLPTALVTGATAALIATDPQTMPYFRQTDTFQDSDHALRGTVTGGVIAVVPATFYVVSLIRKDSYGQATSLLAGEAVVDDAVLMVVTKAIARRLRPTDIAVNGNYSDTFFKWQARSAGNRQQLSVRPRTDEFLHRHHIRAPLSRASLGSVRRVWRGRGDQLLAHHERRSLSVRRLVRGGDGIRDRAVRRSARAVIFNLTSLIFLGGVRHC